MRSSSVLIVAVIAGLLTGIAAFLVFEGTRGPEDAERTLPLIAPGFTGELEVDENARPLGELIGGVVTPWSTSSLWAYTERGEVRRAQLGSTVHWEGGKPCLEDGTPLVGIALNGPGPTFTLMGIAPTAASSLDLDGSYEWPPFTSAKVRRVVVLELDGLGWSLLEWQRGLLKNITSSGDPAAALTAYPPRTNTGTAMILTGTDPLHNGIMVREDRQLFGGTVLDLCRSAGLSTIWIEGDKSILSPPAVLNADTNGDGSFDDEVLSDLSASLDDGTDVIFAHFHSIDEAFHSGGPSSEGLACALERIDSYVGDVIGKLAGSDIPTLLVLASDHGLHWVEGGRGGHGSFRHEDMYAFVSFSSFGNVSTEAPPVLSLKSGGVVVRTFSEDDLEEQTYIEGKYRVRSSSGEKESIYRGIEVWDLLNGTGLSAPVGSVVLTARDGISVTLPREWVLDGTRTIISYQADGVPLAEDEGPLRLIVPQDLAGEFNGQYCLKDVVTLEVSI